MLRRFLDFQLSFIEKRKSLLKLRPLVSALDAFCYEAPLNTKTAPFIRDAIDLKRWMFIVLLALLPAILMAIWNTGMQKMVYGSGDAHLMKQYLVSSQTFAGYFHFAFSEDRYATVLKYGISAFFPIMIISYLVGGLCEAIIACLRKHEISEGFLVTGMLYPLILPPTIPYWMVALGIAFGVIIGKELFGGTGMNILNPALTARAFLFFTFPGKMTGDVWVGTNPTSIAKSLKKMQESSVAADGFTQASPLATVNASSLEIKNIHTDAIASNVKSVPTVSILQSHLREWNDLGHHEAVLGQMTPEQIHSFVTAPSEKGGLGLMSDLYPAAEQLTDVIYGTGHYSDGNLFFGNIIGSMGETSTFACLLGAFLLIFTGIGSWRTMASFGLSAFIFAYLFEFFSHVGIDGGAWKCARYAVPAYRQLMMGGLCFGLVFMATDPVSSPIMKGSKWIYGSLIGIITILIRTINPAYPEGVMLAILFGNVFAPLIDYHVIRQFRKKKNYARRFVQASS